MSSANWIRTSPIRAADVDKPQNDADQQACKEIEGRSAALRQIRRHVARVARSRVPILITGETGVGKEVVAQAVHRYSSRSSFVAFAITELAESLAEAELFGHERGAFTGAVEARQGLFEVADGGTLFIDEIGDASPALQSKLLRIIETSEVRRVGSARPRTVDTRLIFATHRDLSTEVREGRIREDLYFRLTQAAIHIPPLRERSEDVLPLAEKFLRDFAGESELVDATIPEDVIELLEAQPWRGNARELRSVMQYLVFWPDENGRIDNTRAIEALVNSNPQVGPEDQFLMQRMFEAYRTANGNQEAARRSLGMTRSAWRHRWNRFGIDLSRRRPRAIDHLHLVRSTDESE